MRRLLQFGTIVLLIAAFVPLLEIFDHWDAPGLSNDTEFSVYALVFAICLALLVCRLISSGALNLGFVASGAFLRDDKAKPIVDDHTSIFIVPPLFVLPLRI